MPPWGFPWGYSRLRPLPGAKAAPGRSLTRIGGGKPVEWNWRGVGRGWVGTPSAAMLSRVCPRGCSREGSHHDNVRFPPRKGRGGAGRCCSAANRKSRQPEASKERRNTKDVVGVEERQYGRPGKKMRKRDAIPTLIYPRSYAPYRDAG